MCAGVFLVVQWLKLPFPTHWDVGLIPSWGAKISTWLMAKKPKYKTEAIFNKAFKNGPHQKKTLKKNIYTHCEWWVSTADALGATSISPGHLLFSTNSTSYHRSINWGLSLATCDWLVQDVAKCTGELMSQKWSSTKEEQELMYLPLRSKSTLCWPPRMLRHCLPINWQNVKLCCWRVLGGAWRRNGLLFLVLASSPPVCSFRAATG